MNFETWKFGHGKWDDSDRNYNFDGYFCEIKM